ncbi:MAG: o-succinylbenzoate--CoA ligase, partial [Chloroflexi bacterium]|nr:o-succinylbenzoate--CoA ligase [Chloroflexota bacterium]
GAGIEPGSRVALLARDTAATVAVIHGVRRAGTVLVPLNRRAALPELQTQLAAIGVRSLVHDTEHADRAAAAVETAGGETVLQPVASLVVAGGAMPAGRPPPPPVDLDAPATIMFTSGTTGLAKAAVLTHGNHLASAAAWATRLEPHPTDRWLACLPLFHVGGLAMAIRASRWGLPLDVHDGFDATAVSRAIESGVSHLSLVAVMLERLLHARGSDPVPSTLRAILLGGGPVSPGLLRRASDHGLPVVTTYGLTETASGVVADGRPLREVELRIGEPGSDGVGEIQVRGPMVFAGYDGDPGATAAVLAGGWLHTGDLGSVDADGSLDVADRRDDLIVSGGENVSPAEVEAVLGDHPAVIDAAVVGRADDRWGSVPVAIVVIRPGARISDEDLARHCRDRLAGYKVPRAFRRVAALPRSPGGKLLRRDLRIGQERPSDAPRQM